MNGRIPVRRALLGLLTVMALTGPLPSPAWATLFNNGTGLASPTTTITFNEVAVAQNAAVTSQFAALGATFSGLYMDPCVANSGNFFPNMSGRALGNFAGCSSPAGEHPFSIVFEDDVSEAAFVMIGNGGFPELTALLDGSVVETGFGAGVHYVYWDNWYGFTGIVFDEIRVNPAVFQGYSTIRIDNLQFVTAPAGGGGSNLPEPATAVLLLFGFGALALMRRRRGCAPTHPAPGSGGRCRIR